jgi:hypothetical protein
MPKGNPGQIKPGQIANAIERTGREGDLETLAAVWPKLMRALDNLPPTPAEIMRVRMGPDPPKGFRFLPRVSNRWSWSDRSVVQKDTPQHKGDREHGGTQR